MSDLVKVGSPRVDEMWKKGLFSLRRYLWVGISPSSEGVRESYLAEKTSEQRELLSNATAFDKNIKYQKSYG